MYYVVLLTSMDVLKMEDLDEQRQFNAHLVRELAALRRELADLKEKKDHWKRRALELERELENTGQ